TYIETWDAEASGGAGAWENATASAYGNPFAWTGQRYDASVGMYQFLFRSYSPELGRWMQRDPLRYVDGVNLYECVTSSPVVWVDPLGLIIEYKKGRGASDADVDKAKQLVADAKTRRNPDGTKGRGVQDIEKLEADNKHTVTIEVVKGVEPGADIKNARDASDPSKGSDTKIQIDPDDTRPLPDKTPGDPESLVVHELHHARRNADGTRQDTIYEREQDACDVENEHRRNKGVDQIKERDGYPVKQHDKPTACTQSAPSGAGG
ncbi:MAG: hypothetical protein GX616_25860, partial [Planctomycetes bacterium]|nr:hypothetical protein [Planctomycetota bacterium]